jgi:hypothetical protein
MRLFSRSANASVGRFFEGATAMEQTCTSNSFRGSVPTEMILGVPSQDRSSAWVSRTPFVPMCCHGRTRAGVPKVDASGLQIGSLERELRRVLGLAGFPEPVAVGYGAHFGMGRFMAEDNQKCHSGREKK